MKRLRTYFVVERNRVEQWETQNNSDALKKMRGNKVLSFLTFGVTSVLYS